MMGVEPGRPVYIHLSNNEGPELVRKDYDLQPPGDHLTFVKNATQNLFTKKLGEEFDKAIESGKPLPHQIRIRYDNTLFEQLTSTLASSAYLENVLKNQFDLMTEADPNDKTTQDSRHFSVAELSKILKQIIDLPRDVLNRMNVRRMVRMGKDERAHLGSYSAETGTIRFFPATFGDSNAEAHRSILHELGHALWANLPQAVRDAFTEISWRKDKNGIWHLKDGERAKFLSHQAALKPEEDFAEHFAGYMDRPEALRADQKAKYDFYHAQFFPTTEYYTRASGRAVIDVPSDNPDIVRPYVEDRDKDIEVTASLDEKEGALQIICKVRNAKDDLSGIKGAHVSYGVACGGNELYGQIRLVGCGAPELGNFEITHRISLANQYEHSEVHLYSLNIEDRAGNLQSYEIDRKFPLPGKLKSLINKPERINPPLDLDKVKIQRVGKNSSEAEEFEVTLPTSYPADLAGVSLRWQTDSDPPETHFTFANRKTGEKLGLEEWNKEEKGPVKLRIGFAKELLKGVLRLKEIELGWSEHRDSRYLDDKNRPNLMIHLNPSDSDTTPPDIDVNEMKAKLRRRCNRIT